MNSQDKSIRLFFIVAVLGMAAALAVGSGEQKGAKPVMGIVDQVGKQMGQRGPAMDQIDTITPSTQPSAKSLMDMRNLLVGLGGISQSMMAMMDNLRSLKTDNALMKDMLMTAKSEQMKEHLQQMADTMRLALENMQAMAERMVELQKN